MAFKRTFSAEQLKLNGLLLTGSSDGLYFNGGLVGATSGVNIGGGAGEIISGKIDSDLQVRTIKAGSNISVTTSDNEITIASTIPASQTADIAALKVASGYLHTSVQLISGDLDTAEVGITNLNTATKTNLSTYLEQYRTLTDAINIKNAFVINDPVCPLNAPEISVLI